MLLNATSWVKHIVAPETNIVVIELEQPEKQKSIIEQLARNGVLTVAFGLGKIRFVTHLDINQNDLNLCAERFKEIK